ncbi:MAG: putative lipid II flippase FtsW [Candidatus Velamenicoccus archaeovorus]
MARAEASMRAPHLRLVRSAPVVASRVRPEVATRRTVVALLAATAFLVLGGLVMVLSASSVSAYAQYGSSFLFFKRQAAYAIVGTGALVLTARMRYQAWRRLALLLLAITVGLLALVLLHPTAGVSAYGSTRWIALGPVTIQPSEIAKLTLVVFASAVLAKKWGKLDELGHVALPLLPVVGAMCGLVFLQPDLGTTTILVGTLLLMLFAAGVRLRVLLAGTVTMVATALVMLKPYQWARITAFLHPEADPQNTGYQLMQSLIALGSGGWLGVGLGASRQKWMYVPNAHTDFIFSILGEELGLLGELAVLAAFGLLLYAGVRIAVRAPDVFGRLLATGIVSWFGLQVVVNLGAVTGLLPVTGVPLPLLSYGGSSLVVSLAAVGVLVNVAVAPARAAARRPAPRARRRRAA